MWHLIVSPGSQRNALWKGKTSKHWCVIIICQDDFMNVGQIYFHNTEVIDFSSQGVWFKNKVETE